MIGQIVREYGQTLEVEKDSAIYLCFPRKNIESTVVGDWVRFEFDQASRQGVITERLPRRSVLCRSDRYHPVKEMAANIDQVVAMVAVMPAPNEFYLDQYLVAAELSHLPVVIVYNKIDLLDAEFPEGDLPVLYKNIGYQVLPISTKTGQGLDALLASLQGKTTFLLGASGVGKSSLLNTLLGEARARVNLISAANAKGQHTTSVSMLYHLSADTTIIDVPGIRELNLIPALRPNLLQGFAEFRPLIGHCRFRNCSHRDDPGCVIVEKVNAGELSAQRLKNFYRMSDAT